MSIIGRRTHGYWDELMAFLLIGLPWLFVFFQGGAESVVPVAIGGMMLISNVFTDYEHGLIRRISMRTHLALDCFSGLLLAASPRIFGLSDMTLWPHVVFGLIGVIAGVFTKSQPYQQNTYYPSYWEVVPCSNRRRITESH